jgi:DNA-directed RNA polymerase I, II, and III subunit RPABC2
MDDKYASDDEIDMVDSDIDENENVLELPKMVLKEKKIEDEDLDEDGDEDYKDDDEDGDEDDGDEDENPDKDEDVDVDDDVNPLQLQLNEEINGISEDDNDDDDEEDENYLQKFNENLKRNIINENHPELHFHNYDEINNLTTVVRDDTGKIVDPLHRTLPFLTKYEKSRILGERATQINAGAKPFIDVEPNVIDGYLIALAELEQRKIPFIIKRPLSNGGCEYWKLKDLEQII